MISFLKAYWKAWREERQALAEHRRKIKELRRGLDNMRAKKDA